MPQDELRGRHRRVLDVLGPLIERLQREGTFRSDVPAEWHLSMVMALVHAASAELEAGRMPAERVEPTLVATVLGALAGPK